MDKQCQLTTLFSLFLGKSFNFNLVNFGGIPCYELEMFIQSFET